MDFESEQGYSFGGKRASGAPTPAQVLEELQAQLAERNLPEEQVETLLKDPVAYLSAKVGQDEARNMVATVASLYFLTLHKRAVEGEAFTEARLRQALIEARTRTLEALATHVQSAELNQVFKVAELVSKD
ncbi:MAG TPA: hypothetical protein VK465_01455 [Fibrobacteria bacterium]|nr:hypothetical protein [Fibrobacteria bacterium]